MEKRPREAFSKERCLAFVSKLWEADHLAMFHHPVSATEVPGYYEVITSPIDLSTIKGKIEGGKYTSDADVQDDVALMISNALEFNETGTEWYNLAKQMRKEYLALAKQCGLNVDDDAAFIPSKKARDDESTLRKAEAKYGEKLDAVLGDLEKEREIPLEELRKMYHRSTAAPQQEKSSSPDDDDDDEEESSENTSTTTSDAAEESESGSDDDSSIDESTTDEDTDSSSS